MGIIQAEHLTKRFGQFVAIEDVSFEVKKGEIFGFLGPNGAGKTTTINILCTLIKPTSGRAFISSYDVVKEPAKVRSKIGLVFQNPSLDERMSAWENLLFHAYIYNLPGKEIKKRMEEILRLVEMWERRNSLVRTFSGGMKRRLELGRGLLHQPEVLFLDEPTLGLDPQSRVWVWEYIHRIREEKGITIFLTTHYMEEAENAHRIGIIDRGRIIALDTPQELRKKVGGDIIRLRTRDDKEALRELRLKFGVEASLDGQGIRFEVVGGDSFLPRLLEGLSVPVESISLSQPTLDDVFIKLTGRELRDKGSSPFRSIKKLRK